MGSPPVNDYPDSLKLYVPFFPGQILQSKSGDYTAQWKAGRGLCVTNKNGVETWCSGTPGTDSVSVSLGKDGSLEIFGSDLLWSTRAGLNNAAMVRLEDDGRLSVKDAGGHEIGTWAPPSDDTEHYLLTPSLPRHSSFQAPTIEQISRTEKICRVSADLCSIRTPGSLNVGLEKLYMDVPALVDSYKRVFNLGAMKASLVEPHILSTLKLQQDTIRFANFSQLLHETVKSLGIDGNEIAKAIAGEYEDLRKGLDEYASEAVKVKNVKTGQMESTLNPATEEKVRLRLTATVTKVQGLVKDMSEAVLGKAKDLDKKRVRKDTPATANTSGGGGNGLEILNPVGGGNGGLGDYSDMSTDVTGGNQESDNGQQSRINDPRIDALLDQVARSNFSNPIGTNGSSGGMSLSDYLQYQQMARGMGADSKLHSNSERAHRRSIAESGDRRDDNRPQAANPSVDNHTRVVADTNSDKSASAQFASSREPASAGEVSSTLPIEGFEQQVDPGVIKAFQAEENTPYSDAFNAYRGTAFSNVESWKQVDDIQNIKTGDVIDFGGSSNLMLKGKDGQLFIWSNHKPMPLSMADGKNYHFMQPVADNPSRQPVAGGDLSPEI